MPSVWIHKEEFDDIGDAIREKLGTETQYTIEQMAPAIDSIISHSDEGVNDYFNKSLTSYTNNRISAVRSYAFYKHTSLTSINLPNVINIGENAFSQCSLTSINLPNVNNIGYYAFSYNDFSSISLPNVKTIGGGVFYGCGNLTSISLPELTTIDMSNGIGSFCDTQLTSINLPKLTTITNPSLNPSGRGMFANCSSLTTLNFPNLTHIGVQGLSDADYLTSITLPKAVFIDDFAFAKCSSLTSLTLSGSTVCTLNGTNAFYDTAINSRSGYIYVPSNLVNSYKAATNWSTYASRIKAIGT